LEPKEVMIGIILRNQKISPSRIAIRRLRNDRAARAIGLPNYCGAGAVEAGVGFPSIVLGSINSIRVPSGS
jgi:hypothetical protein